MTDPVLLVSRSPEGITTLTLNDPDRRNALSLALRSALLAQLQAEAADPATRALILTGAGKGFCAGGDISAMGLHPEMSLERLRILHDIARALAVFPRPVIAAVHGAAFGAGLSLALLADRVIAAPGTQLGVGFLRMGLVPDTGFLWSAQRRIGKALALRLVLDNAVLNAERAQDLGLIDAIADDPAAAALDQARIDITRAPLAFAATKRALATADGQLEALLAQEFADQAQMYRSADHREAVAAFREKREPVFRGE